MAGASKRNEFSDDEVEWTTNKKRPAKSGSSSGLLIGAAVVLLILVVGALALWRHQEMEEHRTQAEYDRAVAEQHAFDARIQAEHWQDMQAQANQELATEPEGQPFDGNPLVPMVPFAPELRERPAFLHIARAQMCLEADDLDGAVESYRQAALLEGEFQAQYELLLKVQQSRKRPQTAPQPRVKQPK